MHTDNLAIVRRWAGDSERWLAEFLQDVPLRPAIVVIVVMGSAVRDRGHRRSDLDLLLVYRDKRPEVRRPLEVDIRFVDIERLYDEIARGREIPCWALKFGAALYDPENVWGKLQQAWGERVPLPCAAEARRRGEEALARAIEMLDLGDDSAADDLLLAALTQFAREQLLLRGIFPASRPELPEQLRTTTGHNRLADLLQTAMYGDLGAIDLVKTAKELGFDSSGRQKMS